MKSSPPRAIIEEMCSDEREARMVAEEERRERKRHDIREILSRERDEGRRKKRVLRDSN